MITSIAAKDRGKPLSLSGADLDGKPLDIAAYRGKILVINIWGSWCGGCRAEAGHLEAVAQATRSKGVDFVGIDTRDLQLAAPQQFIKTHHISYPSFYDASGDLLLKFPKGICNPQFIPSTLVLDREGRLAARSLKPLGSDDLNKMLASVLAEKS